MGYRPVSAWEAFNSYIPATLARPLRSGPLVPTAPQKSVRCSTRYSGPELSVTLQDEQVPSEGGAQEEEEHRGLTFRAPEALLTPFPAHPLRIFVRLFSPHLVGFPLMVGFSVCVCCRTRLQACRLTNPPPSTWRATWTSTSAPCRGNSSHPVSLLS